MDRPVASVLVVDDNVDFLDVVHALLKEGTPAFGVHTVQTGAAALAFLEQLRSAGDTGTPAFIVLDFHLEDMDAPVVLERLASMEATRGIPVLVLSVSGWDEDETAVMAAGAHAFCVKPARTHALRDTLIGFWERHVESRVLVE